MAYRGVVREEERRRRRENPKSYSVCLAAGFEHMILASCRV